MANELIYLDHAATTPVAPEVLEAMLPHLRGACGNPSSQHAAGREACGAVDTARQQVAAVLGCEAREVTFTSGGTEADNLALRGVVARWRRTSDQPAHIVTTAIEHDAVLATAEQLAEAGDATVTVVGCDAAGRIDPDEIVAALRPETAVVSVMLANNEVGTVQDLAEISHRVHAHRRDIVVHTDAVQAVGKIPCRVRDLGVDLLSLSGHKLYGPKGIGALWIRSGVVLVPQITGGGQERRRRSGTENVAAIVGLGRAAELTEAEREHETTRIATLAGRLRELVLAVVPDAVLSGSELHRLPHIVSFAFPGVLNDVLLTALDGQGVCASGGSACSSGAALPSHVLMAMGMGPELARCSLRCSLGRGTTGDDVDRAAQVIGTAVLHARLQAATSSRA